MANFPSLQPAFTARLKSGPGWNIGTVSNGATVQVIPVTSGRIESETDYDINLQARLQHGADTVRIQPSQTHVSINVDAVFQDQSGHYLIYRYHGLIKIDPDFMAIFTNSPSKSTTKFGQIFTQIQFEVGAEPLKSLEERSYVGSAHFVVEDDGGFIIETKIGQVVHH